MGTPSIAKTQSFATEDPFLKPTSSTCKAPFRARETVQDDTEFSEEDPEALTLP